MTKIEKIQSGLPERQSFGARAWTLDSNPGKAQAAPGHQKEKFQSLFPSNKVETAGQVALQGGSSDGSGSSGAQLNVIA